MAKIVEESNNVNEGESSLNDYFDSKQIQLVQKRLINESDSTNKGSEGKLNVDLQESNQDYSYDKQNSASNKRHFSCSQVSN